MLVSLAVVVPGWRVVWGVLGPASHRVTAFEDDTFYYAVIAEHLAHGRGSTFGGLVPTNGYQPLWQLVLVPLAVVADGDAFLRLLFLLVTVLFAATVVLMWRIAGRLQARAAFGYAAVYATVVGLAGGNVFFSGMEIAAVVPAVLLLVLVCLSVLPQGAGRSALRSPVGSALRSRVGAGLALGGCALLVVLSRLDAVGMVVVLGGIAWVHGDRVARRAVAIAGLVLAAGLVGYAAVDQAWFGTPVPVSGEAKDVGGGRMGWSLLTDYLHHGALGHVPLFFGVQVLAVTAVALVLLRRARTGSPLFAPGTDPVVRDLLIACLAGQAVQLAFYSATSAYPFWNWYFYFVPVQLFLAGAVIAQAAVRSRAGRPLALPVVLVGLALLGGLAQVGVVAFDQPETSWSTAAPAVAAWIRQHTGPSDVVAVGDRAGYLTWLTRRPTVQLEGLVQDPAYLRYLADGRIAEYMRRSGVRWYVRSVQVGVGSMPSATSCSVAVEPVQGRGPKSAVPVCPRDLVYRDSGSDYVWAVWRFEGGTCATPGCVPAGG